MGTSSTIDLSKNYMLIYKKILHKQNIIFDGSKKLYKHSRKDTKTQTNKNIHTDTHPNIHIYSHTPLGWISFFVTV